MSNKDVPIPKMTHLRREVKKAVDPLEVALKTVSKLRNKEFLSTHCKFYGKSEIREGIICEEDDSQPIATLLNPDYFKEDEDPKYENHPLLHLNEAEDWYHAGTTDLTDKFTYAWTTLGTQEEADEVEGGILRVDLIYAETDAFGFYLMSAKGLKMLKENDPQLYKAMTCLGDGHIDEDFEVVEKIETKDWNRFTVPILDRTSEPGATVLVDNFYYWTFSAGQDGITFDVHGSDSKYSVDGKKRWASRERASYGDMGQTIEDLLGTLLRQVPGDYIL